MKEKTEAMAVAETFLQEMLEADDNSDFELYTRRYEDKYLGEFTRETFARDIQQMHERNGMNQSYEYFGSLRNAEVDGLDVYRFVWKGVYEKRDAVIELAVYLKNGNWHVIKSSVY